MIYCYKKYNKILYKFSYNVIHRFIFFDKKLSKFHIFYNVMDKNYCKKNKDER